MRVAIAGLGLIGQQRLSIVEGLNRDPEFDIDLVGTLDPNRTGGPCEVRTLDELLAKGPEILFVAVPHSSAEEIIVPALESGVRVHVEKPLGMTLDESMRLASFDPTGNRLTVGYNYRFFRGVEEMIKDVQSGRFGELIRVEMTLGHGGSPDDASSWKLDPILAGGGCLLDPGVHLLDLVLQLTSNPRVLACHTWSGFWKTGIEEDATVLLESEKLPLIQINLSIVRWRSEFLIKVIGTDGYGVVSGRGRSYGPQVYKRGERWGWRAGKSQVDSEEIVVLDDCEGSFEREVRQLIQRATGVPEVCTGHQAVDVMRLYEQVVKSSGLTHVERISRK